MKRFVAALFVLLGFSTAAVACPDWRAGQGDSYSYSGQQLYQKRELSVVAGGSNFIGACPVPGGYRNNDGTASSGYFTTVPDFTFFVSGMGQFQLVVDVVSACDSALIVNTQSGTYYYDDDDNGNLDPRIVLTRPLDGRIDIWIGTYDGSYCDAVLGLETFFR